MPPLVAVAALGAAGKFEALTSKWVLVRSCNST
jgi:hypothetical protein